MGLLDTLNDPVMALGAGLLNAGGYSRMPVSLGQGLAAGMQGYQQASRQQAADKMQREQFDIQRQLHMLQLQKAQQEIQQNEAAKQRLSEYVQSMPDGPEKQKIIQAVSLGVPVSKVWETMNREPEKPQLVEIEGATPGTTVKKWLRPGETDGAVVGNAAQKLPEGMRIGPTGQRELDPLYMQMREMISAAGRAPQQPSPAQIVQTDQGMMMFDPRARTMQPAMGPTGEPIKPKMKDIPNSAMTAIIENKKGLAAIDEAIQAIEENPQSLGAKNYLGDTIRQRTDPKGVTARAKVAQVGGIRLHDLTGAAMTAAEMARLQPYIPTTTDAPEVAKTKLKNLRQEYAGILATQEDMFSESQGYRGIGQSQNAGPKVATLQDIQETARKSGKSTAEVTAALKAKGYTIRGQ